AKQFLVRGRAAADLLAVLGPEDEGDRTGGQLERLGAVARDVAADHVLLDLGAGSGGPVDPGAGGRGDGVLAEDVHRDTAAAGAWGEGGPPTAGFGRAAEELAIGGGAGIEVGATDDLAGGRIAHRVDGREPALVVAVVELLVVSLGPAV